MPVFTALPMEGRRIGHWTVIERSGRDKKGNALWLCRCDCGERCIKSGVSLRRRAAGYETRRASLQCRDCYITERRLLAERLEVLVEAATEFVNCGLLTGEDGGGAC